MQRELSVQTLFFRDRSKKRKLRKRIVTGLASIVVFCTTYALILPAITLEGYICGTEAHQHDESCYIAGPTRQNRTLICDGGLGALHQHDESCYDGGTLICGYADYILHEHDTGCYDSAGELVCPLEELEEHQHDESCRQQPHVHDEDCYTLQRGALLCQTEEGSVHTHGEDCRVARQELICPLEEDGEHTHTEDCRQTVYDLVCTMEEDVPHVHTDECYAWEPVLTCTLPTAEDGAQPELICGQEERQYHIHDESCWDENGRLTCGLLQTEIHTHNSLCYLVTETAGEPVLVCEQPVHVHDESCLPPEDEPESIPWDDSRACGMAEHEHGDSCYNAEGYLICTMPEHTHWELCDLDPNKRDMADPDDSWLEALPVNTGDAAADLTAVALAQVGYRESDAYYTVTDEDEILWYSRYADWWNGDGFADWNASLAAFCLEAAEVQGVPLTNSAARWPALLADADLWQDAAETQPQAGELAFFDRDGDGEAESVGIITEAEAENGSFTAVLEQSGRVREKTFSTDSATLLGYGLLEQAQEMFCGKGEHAHNADCYDEAGLLICGLDAHMHSDACLRDGRPTDAERRIAETELAEQIDALDTEFLPEAAQTLLEQLDEAHGAAYLSDEAYLRLYARVRELLDGMDVGAADGVAEAAEGTNWILLRDSGWFEEYSDYGIASYSDYGISLMAAAAGDVSPSAVQIDEFGDANTADDVTVSKTIAGTDIENVFDITLTVETPQKIAEVISEPDMAVVIVMDISNTMKENFTNTSVTRYQAAMDAAEDFLDKFAESNTLGVSKVGYVAFNTNAHQIFDLQPCINATQANTLKNTMRNATGSIINNYQKNEKGQVVDHERFTNIEGGLKMAQDMLDEVSNKNKFIILLTDGFPTTYVSSGYNGYDPYTPSGTIGNDGVFYDEVSQKYCSSGTSYSDKAAIRARKMATKIKNNGTTIFSIGVDVGGQTIEKYLNLITSARVYVVDRTSTTYEIGSATNEEAYKNWLKNNIGSGYYYDSTNTAGLKDAYNQIFEKIKTTVETATAADWVASDPIPSVTPDEIDFIGLYDKDEILRGNSLTGSPVQNAENTASYGNSTITWDLKESGYTTTTEGEKTIYSYKLTYRIRLRNEDDQFVENKVYNTNGETTLRYRVTQAVNGNITISDTRTINFPMPSVHGYLGELTFNKTDSRGNALAGAEFTLHHADDCNICRGDKTQVEIADQIKISGEDGKVTFANIPSGHTYTLTETRVPDGYSANGNHYTVKVAYDVVTVDVTDYNDITVEDGWNDVIVNNVYYELPETGGGGAGWYYAAGSLLCITAAALLPVRKRRRKGASPPA